jgi:hypothetical protein
MTSLVDSSGLKQLMAQIGTKFSILYFNFFSLTIGQIIKLSINPSVFGREVFRSFQLPQESKADNPKVAGSNPAPPPHLRQ